MCRSIHGAITYQVEISLIPVRRKEAPEIIIKALPVDSHPRFVSSNPRLSVLAESKTRPTMAASSFEDFIAHVRRVTLTDPTFSHLTITTDFPTSMTVTDQTGYSGLPWQKLDIQPIQLKQERGSRLKFSYLTARQDVTKNYRPAEAAAWLDSALAWPIRAIRLETVTDQWHLQLGKRGTPIIHHNARLQPSATTTSAASPTISAAPVVAHDHSKAVPFPAGEPNTLLTSLGLIDAAGRVRPSMHAKMTQVNAFLTLLDQTVDPEQFAAAEHRPLNVLDCGCGAAYLSLAAYHYLNDKRGVPATLTGIDYNGHLIDEDNQLAEQLNYGNACFYSAAIQEYRPDPLPDVLVALHACDTASDDALALGIRYEARVILCAPCCHAQLRRELDQVPTPAPFAPLMRHGIIERRFADMLTDTFRALILRVLGYKTDVIEFVAAEHTEKNLMIRAVRRPNAAIDTEALAEYQALKSFWGVTPNLERLLGDARLSG
jgi:SAM-dependent methyltransferase